MRVLLLIPAIYLALFGAIFFMGTLAALDDLVGRPDWTAAGVVAIESFACVLCAVGAALLTGWFLEAGFR